MPNGDESAAPPAAGLSRPDRRRGVLGMIALALVLLTLVFTARACESFLGLNNPFATRTTDRSQPVLLKSIQDMSRYQAATANLQVIIDVEKDAKFIPSAIYGQRTLFVAAGTVDAYVDFTGLTDKALTVSDDRRKVTVRLPRPALAKPNLDHKRSYVHAQDMGIVDRFRAFMGEEANKVQQLNVLAEDKLTAAARESDLTKTAEKNTRAMLEGMFRSLGYTSVTVEYVSP